MTSSRTYGTGLRTALVATITAVAVGFTGATAAQAAEPIQPGTFTLERSSSDGDVVAALDLALPNVSIDAVAADANRIGPTGEDCTSVLPQVSTKYCWKSDDNNTNQWWAQGVTSTYDAYAGSGLTPGGRQLLVASWYDRDQEQEDDNVNKGARISVLDRATAEYRHVLLVVPSGTSSSPTFTIANTHAGGLAWYGRYLHVSDTDGIRVFDMSRIWQVRTSIENAIGATADGYGAYGYKYVVPQVHRYERNTANMFRYSSVAVDRTTSPDTLVATEYRKPGDSSQAAARTVTYSFDEGSGLLNEPTNRVAPARAAWRIGVDSLQGGVFVNNRLYLSQSDGRNPFSTSDRGDVYRYTPSSGQIRRWADHLPIGTEDLSFWAGRGELWTTAEYPELRGLYALNFGYYSS